MPKSSLPLHIRKKLAAINATRLRIAAQRDRLREQLSDFEDILDSVETADERLVEGIQIFNEALDELSKYL